MSRKSYLLHAMVHGHDMDSLVLASRPGLSLQTVIAGSLEGLSEQLALCVFFSVSEIIKSINKQNYQCGRLKLLVEMFGH